MDTEHFDPAAEISRCSMCATCTYVCPVFIESRVEGHTARGHLNLIDAFLVEPGRVEANPDGTAALGVGAGRITPEFERMLECCLRCYKCMDVCPSNIKTVKVFEHARAELTSRSPIPRLGDQLLARLLSGRASIHFISRLAALAQSLWMFIFGARRKENDGVFQLGRSLALPRFAHRPFLASAFARARAPGVNRTRTESANSGARAGEPLRVAYFVDCMTDTIYPSAARATVEVLEAAGVEVVIPASAGCCGAPMLGTGDTDAFKRMAGRAGEMLRSVECDHIVTSSPTCAKTMKFEYTEMSGRDFEGLAGKVMMDFELIAKLSHRLEFRRSEAAVGWHDPCHQKFALGITREPRELLSKCVSYTPREGEDLCCGFGGTFSRDFPGMAADIAARKAAALDGGAESEIATSCPACAYFLNRHSQITGGDRKAVLLSEVIARSILHAGD